MTGWTVLLRSHLRRDRWFLLWWTAGTVLLFWSQGISIIGLYSSQAEFDRAAASMDDNAAFVAMAGPARALNSVGGQVFWQSSAFGAVVVGLMSMLLVGRHTRAEEESGRDELVRATAIGRRAPLVAALVGALAANLVIGILVTASLLTVRQGAVDLQGVPMPFADSLATGLGLTACGWFFCASALVAAQLTQSTRGMYGIAGIVIAAAYLLRAVGDVAEPGLSWLSPIGWYQAMAAFADLTWWPILLPLAAASGLVWTALRLFEHRDIGSGLWSARPGPAAGGAGLRSGIGLAWRLHRGAVVGWVLGMLIVGLSYGSVGNSVEDLMGDSDFARAMGGNVTGDLVEGFYGTAIVMLALMSAGFAISSTVRPRGEEDDGRLEVLLATGLSRHRWLAGHVAITVLGTTAVLAASGVGLGVGYALTTGDGEAVLRYAAPTMTYLVPVLLLAAVARLLYGLSARLLVLAWLPLVLSAVVLIFGDTLRIPQWIQDVSPFEHLALAPAQDVRWAPLLVLAALAVGVSAAAAASFRRRDIG